MRNTYRVPGGAFFTSVLLRKAKNKSHKNIENITLVKEYVREMHCYLKVAVAFDVDLMTFLLSHLCILIPISAQKHASPLMP